VGGNIPVMVSRLPTSYRGPRDTCGRMRAAGLLYTPSSCIGASDPVAMLTVIQGFFALTNFPFWPAYGKIVM